MTKYRAPEISDQIAPGRASRARRDDDGLAAPMLGGATQPSAFGTSEVVPYLWEAKEYRRVLRSEGNYYCMAGGMKVMHMGPITARPWTR